MLTVSRLRWLGLAGLMGAGSQLTGDLLYLFTTDAAASFGTTLSTVPEWRLLAGGALALVACWFYVLGSGQMYYALRPAGPRLAAISSIFWGATLSGFAICHAAFFAVAAVARFAAEHGANADAAAGLAFRYYNLLVGMLQVPAVIMTVLLIYTILFRRTRFPRWMVFLIPTFLILLEGPILGMASGVVHVVLLAGYANIVMLAYFTVSTIVLWNGGCLPSEENKSG